MLTIVITVIARITTTPLLDDQRLSLNLLALVLWWRVIAVAAPLSLAKSGLRIFVLAMLGTRVDRSFLTGKLHRSITRPESFNF
jgi:hypothetical protein